MAHLSRPDDDDDKIHAFPAPPDADAPRKRRGMSWRRWLGIAAILLIGLGGAYAARPWILGEPAPALASSPVVRGDIELSVLATGTLKPAHLVAVGAQVSGRITALNMAIGDDVSAGDLIAEIDPTTRVNDLRTAEANLASVIAQKTEKETLLATQERTLERQAALADRSAISQADLEEAEGNVAVTRAQIEALEAQVAAARVAIETAEVNLGYTQITAPIDGTVLAISAQQGQTVNSVQDAPTIVVLGDLDTMAVHVEISEADVPNVEIGQRVYFTILGDRETEYEATLTSIAPAPDSITEDTSLGLASTSSNSSTTTKAIYYDGIFEVRNPERRLRTYMTAEVHVVQAQAQDALLIPSAALGAKSPDGSHAVRVLEPDGTVAQRQVHVGINDRSQAEVLSDLSVGERVVTGTAQAGDGPPSSEGRRRMPDGPMGF